MRARPGLSLLAVFALLFAGVAGATVAPQGAAVPPAEGSSAVASLGDTPNQATLQTVDRSTYASADVDVAGAVASGATRVGGRHATLAFDERFDRAETSSARLAATTAALDSVEARFASLNERRQRLLAADSDGAISTETFLRRLARLQVAATQEQARIQHIRDRVERAVGFSLPVSTQTRIFRLRADLVALPTPVTDRIVGATTATGGAQLVYVQATDDGLVLATLDDGTHLRQATLGTERAPGEPNQFNRTDGNAVEVALSRAGDLYPWVFENALSGPSLRGFGDTNVYLIEATHPQGTLQTYLDGATENVFHEIQVTDSAEAVPVTATRTAITDSFRLRAETTHPTGPMRLTLLGPDGDGPVNATVYVNGQRVGTTGDDGRLLAVQPAGRFQVNATTGAANISLEAP